MKRSELERKLTKKGAKLHKHGKSHDIWKASDGTTLIVPRGTKINEFTAKQLIKDA